MGKRGPGSSDKPTFPCPRCGQQLHPKLLKRGPVPGDHVTDEHVVVRDRTCVGCGLTVVTEERVVKVRHRKLAQQFLGRVASTQPEVNDDD